MIDIIEIDENNRGLSANCVYKPQQKTINFEFEDEDIRQKVFSNINDYIFNDNELEYDPLKKNNEKIEQETSLQAMMTASARASFLAELSDEKAAMIPLCYDAWTTDKAYKVGDRVECVGKLWKCRQAHTSQENWKPSIETASLWELIGVEHAGTLEDPIPYDQTMTVYNGKYYLEEGIKYKCIRDSGQPLYATCASLVGNYFEVAA